MRSPRAHPLVMPYDWRAGGARPIINRMLTNRRISGAFILAMLPLLLGRATLAHESASQPAVVVELFTSQGCSSCPPADAYLGELAQRPDVLALALHVDYWDYIGWSDPFAEKFATKRQRAYASRLNLRYVYTPQMVVNGTTEGVGSERDTIAALIRAAEQQKAPRPHIALARTADGKIAIHIDGGATAAPATVEIVGFDREDTTPVLRGENEGRTLKDYQVARTWTQIGTWGGAPLDLSVPGQSVRGNGGIAVLLQQDGGHGPIVGAAVLKSPQS
jgi:hypothetical protein